eukprot:SAG22_NODE_77_length_22125_cov_46.140016_11_plen_74_part_00
MLPLSFYLRQCLYVRSRCHRHITRLFLVHLVELFQSESKPEREMLGKLLRNVWHKLPSSSKQKDARIVTTQGT